MPVAPADTGSALLGGRRLVLASGSPRRRQLLALLGVDFNVVPPEIDETPRTDEAARDW